MVKSQATLLLFHAIQTSLHASANSLIMDTFKYYIVCHKLYSRECGEDRIHVTLNSTSGQEMTKGHYIIQTLISVPVGVGGY